MEKTLSRDDLHDAIIDLGSVTEKTHGIAGKGSDVPNPQPVTGILPD